MQVDLIVATHWHQDHVRGLAELVRRCPHAKFSCGRALLRDEFVAYLVATGATLSTSSKPKPAEFLDVMRLMHDRGQIARYADAGRELFSWHGSPLTCKAIALSPSDAEYTRFLNRIASIMPAHFEPRKAATASDPNEASVVVQIAWADTSVLLGADMTVTGDPGRGWKAVMVEHNSRGLQKSAVVKVPHHGSHNAHYLPMWNEGLENNRIAVVTPYGRGERKSRPPTREDIQRISALASRSYLTAHPRTAYRMRFESAVEKTLEEGGIEIFDANQTLGIVRLRRANSSWDEMLFPPAMDLRDAA